MLLRGGVIEARASGLARIGGRLALTLLAALGLAACSQARSSGGRMPVSYTGVDYYTPAPSLTGCPQWTWLRAGCYLHSPTPDPPRRQLIADLAFVRQTHLGRFLRVWVSLDELMYWDGASGYAGYLPRSLANLDDALRQFARSRIKVDLVLLSYAAGINAAYQFHPEALDGTHPAMRAGYLQAVRDLVAHLAANRLDRAAIAVIDLQNEIYFQLEQYFSDPANLGTFSDCRQSAGLVDLSCVDQRIVRPWLVDLYTAARAAGKGFILTASDTGRLLDTNSDAQQHWIDMYPVDVYDVHLYSDHPWTEAERWATGRNLPKPWFVGEAGCAIGSTDCTYDGSNAVRVDSWWLQHLRADGASAVLVEDRSTAWTQLYGYANRSLTATGKALQQAAQG